MPVNPRSLENLTPFTPETAPKGRKNAGLSLIEWVNEMATWCKDEVEAVRDNEREPIIKRRAAERLLDTNDAWNVCDYTNHKPVTKADVTHTTVERVKRIIAPSPN